MDQLPQSTSLVKAARSMDKAAHSAVDNNAAQSASVDAVYLEDIFDLIESMYCAAFQYAQFEHIVFIDDSFSLVSLCNKGTCKIFRKWLNFSERIRVHYISMHVAY